MPLLRLMCDIASFLKVSIILLTNYYIKSLKYLLSFYVENSSKEHNLIKILHKIWNVKCYLNH